MQAQIRDVMEELIKQNGLLSNAGQKIAWQIKSHHGQTETALIGGPTGKSQQRDLAPYLEPLKRKLFRI